MSVHERRHIAGLYRESVRGVLFTVVEVRGSSYRSVGARLFATADGQRAGTLVNDRVEKELLRQPEWHVRDGARVQSFPMALDRDTETADGEVDLLAEPSDAAETSAVMEAVLATLHGEHRTVATLLPCTGISLRRFVMDACGDVLFASDALETEDIVPLRRLALASAHGAVHATEQGSMFVERMEPVDAVDRMEIETMTREIR